MSYSWLYITAGNVEEAKNIAKELVQQRLVACANLLGDISSFYWWEGRVQEDREVAFILKTKNSLIEEVKTRILQLHSYDCPCIVALPITGGNPEFLQWIQKQTKTV